MKTTASLVIALTAFVVTGGVASAQNVNVGTVDMKRVFEGYYKTKEAMSRVDELRNTYKRDVDERAEGLKKLRDEVQKLEEEIKKPELSNDAKQKKLNERNDKATEFQAMDREIRTFVQTREKELNDQSVRMRNTIVEEIMKVVNDQVKSNGYDIVFDRQGVSMNNVPVVLFAKDSYDFSKVVLDTLNKNRTGGTEGDDAPKKVEETKATPTKSPKGK
jgi:Skp family chaperone for outer membrane proteins